MELTYCSTEGVVPGVRTEAVDDAGLTNPGVSHKHHFEESLWSPVCCHQLDEEGETEYNPSIPIDKAYY